jgi:predicted HicB family RNase H-like nuclease
MKKECFITIRVDEYFHSEIKIHAAKYKTSMSEWVIGAMIRQYNFESIEPLKE